VWLVRASHVPIPVVKEATMELIAMLFGPAPYVAAATTDIAPAQAAAMFIRAIRLNCISRRRIDMDMLQNGKIRKFAELINRVFIRAGSL